MSQYKHFKYHERVELARMHFQGATLSTMADRLSRDRCSIGREIKRNGNKDGTYNPDTAQRRYEARRRSGCILDHEEKLQVFVVDQLQENWTPEQIAGWLKSGNEKALPSISHETIYAWIYSTGQRARKLWKLLPWHRAKRGFRPARKTRSLIPDRQSIHQRDETINGRCQGGHWEGDLIICKRTRPVLVLVERKSRFTIIAKLKSKHAAHTAATIMDIFRQLDPRIRQSITFDNGTEFAKHSLLREALQMTTWFCDAYASWQKGGVENMNGRLRRDLPRRINIDAMSDEDIADINLMHNLTPRKCLNFKTPTQALLSQLGIDARLSFHRGVALQI
ncbi:MAG: IS30 family transposase [Gammaproteobacteria bacterium]|nr:IS30 family transposase [Gammaproteobacteria bacterium]